MVIALIIILPVSIALTGFLVLQSVKLGLKWQIQVEQKQEPTLDIPNPVKEIIQHKEQKESEQKAGNILNEWLNGA